jgi:hypothetical protein
MTCFMNDRCKRRCMVALVLQSPTASDSILSPSENGTQKAPRFADAHAGPCRRRREVHYGAREAAGPGDAAGRPTEHFDPRLFAVEAPPRGGRRRPAGLHLPNPPGVTARLR